MLRPVTPRERIQSIDILRGFALLGIVLVNALGFNASFFDFGGYYRSLPDPFQLSFYNLFISLTADKFIFLFSFLFGYGIWLQYSRFRDEGMGFTSFMVRRMGVLALFGIAHILLLWAGDILLLYAFAGLVVLAARKLSTGWQLALAVIFYFFIGIWLTAGVFIKLPDAMTSTCTGCLDQARTVYAHGNYLDCLKLRLHEYAAFRNINLFYYLPKVIGISLFGFIASKMGLHRRLATEPKKWLRIWLVVAIVAVAVYFGYAKVVDPKSRFAAALYMAGYEFMNIWVASTYLLGILLACTLPGIARTLRPVGLMGRMSLTNYLTQSLVLSILFYGWGFGLFGRTNIVLVEAIALGVYFIQILLNVLWFRYYRQGPLERLWRRLSYGK
jgi:uncharacterized protein